MSEIWTSEEYQQYQKTGKLPARIPRGRRRAGGKKTDGDKKAIDTTWTDLLHLQMTQAGLEPKREHMFHHTRKWRLDFALLDLRLGIEVEGGVWSGGRHVRGEGYAADCDKYNQAQLTGWIVLRFTSDMVKAGKAIRDILDAVKQLRPNGETHDDGTIQ